MSLITSFLSTKRRRREREKGKIFEYRVYLVSNLMGLRWGELRSRLIFHIVVLAAQIVGWG
jgi:hypothetical protein